MFVVTYLVNLQAKSNNIKLIIVTDITLSNCFNWLKKDFIPPFRQIENIPLTDYTSWSSLMYSLQASVPASGSSRLSIILLITRIVSLQGFCLLWAELRCWKLLLLTCFFKWRFGRCQTFFGIDFQFLCCLRKYQRRPSVGNIEVSTIFQYGRSLLEVTFFLFRLLVASHFLNGKVKKTESFRLKKTNAAEKIFASQTIKLGFNIIEVPDNQLSAFLIRHLSFL